MPLTLTVTLLMHCLRSLTSLFMTLTTRYLMGKTHMRWWFDCRQREVTSSVGIGRWRWRQDHWRIDSIIRERIARYSHQPPMWQCCVMAFEMGWWGGATILIHQPSQRNNKKKIKSKTKKKKSNEKHQNKNGNYLYSNLYKLNIRLINLDNNLISYT